MNTPFIVLGGGGHAKVVIDTLLRCHKMVLGYTSVHTDNINKVLGVSFIGNDNVAMENDSKQVYLANGVGSTRPSSQRVDVFTLFYKKGYFFPPIIHPHAIIASDVHLEDGVQVMAGAIVQPGCKIGKNSIINTRASVDHDCVIGDHVHIAPGATLSGAVSVGDNVHIGAGAVIIQGVNIGANSIIGAGSVVINDVRESSTMVGVPAREVKR